MRRGSMVTFPPDFMFQLEPMEWENLKSQFVTSSWGRDPEAAVRLHGTGRRNGLERASLPRAIAVNVEIMRAFVRMRRSRRSFNLNAFQLLEPQSNPLAHQPGVLRIVEMGREEIF